MIPAIHMIYFAAFLFLTGLIVVITKRNAIMMLIGLELMLNAANVNLVIFNQFYPKDLQGQMFALFVIIVAVCETAVGLAIIMHAYRLLRTSIPDEISELKG
jgi:NADH:ubiquinone oxidoreductase subunit K